MRWFVLPAPRQSRAPSGLQAVIPSNTKRLACRCNACAVTLPEPCHIGWPSRKRKALKQ
jgi:hypothetical protein